MKVFAYRLLFRSGTEQVFQDTNIDQATSSAISSSFYVTGIDTLTGGNPAFISFTRDLLLKDCAQILPKDKLIVEIPYNLPPDHQVIEAIRRLKTDGYQVALNDLDGSVLVNPLTDHVDFIKVDFSRTTRIKQKYLARHFLPLHTKLVAENVTDYEEFHSAKDIGYVLFQGKFFCQPSMVCTTRIPESNMTKLRLMRILNQDDIDFNEVSQIIKHDVSLSYKLLRFVNSAHMGLVQEVSSIRQALMFLGHRNLRKWITFMAIALLGNGKPTAVVTTALVRARFCELVADLLSMRSRSEELFLLGMLTTIDALLDKPMKEALDEIHIAPNLKSTLLGEPGVFRSILDLVLAYEVGNWPDFASLCKTLEIDQDRIPQIHIDAVKMAEDIFASEEKAAIC